MSMLCETDADEVDIILAGGDPGIANHNPTDQEQGSVEIFWLILLSGPPHLDANSDDDGAGGGETIVTQCEDAELLRTGSSGQKNGNLQKHSMHIHASCEAAIHIGEGIVMLRYAVMLHVNLG
jgi:hypothetical protein